MYKFEFLVDHILCDTLLALQSSQTVGKSLRARLANRERKEKQINDEVIGGFMNEAATAAAVTGSIYQTHLDLLLPGVFFLLLSLKLKVSTNFITLFYEIFPCSLLNDMNFFLLQLVRLTLLSRFTVCIVYFMDFVDSTPLALEVFLRICFFICKLFVFLIILVRLITGRVFLY